MTNAITVAVAPGSGRIARRSQVLLFDPSGDNSELIASFDEAADDAAAITAVKQHLIAAEFQVAPIVVIDWRADGLGLIVFGDAVVHSSAPAAPMISGAGSGTWIERNLGALELGDATEAHVWCGDETDEATDLRLGVVRGGGVRVAVTRQVPVAPAAPVEIPPDDSESRNPRPVPSARLNGGHGTNGSSSPASPPAPAAVPAAAPVDAPIAPAGFVAAPSELEWSDTEPKPGEQAAAPSTVAPSAVATADPFTEADDQVDAAVGATATAATAAAAPVIPFEDSITEPADQLDPIPVLDESVEAGGAGLVEASICSNGHSNPARYTICRTCAVDMDADAEVSLIGQPSVGHLRFADGKVVEIDKTLIIGRKPAGDPPATHPVVVDHAEVSRSHVQVSLDGWAVLATDLDSRNGTWVVPPSDPTPVKLDAHVPYLLEHGTTLHLGGPEASFTYDFGTD